MKNIKALHTAIQVGMRVKLKENPEWYTVESVSHRHPILTLKGVQFPVHLIAIEKYTSNWRKGLTKEELDVLQTLEAYTNLKEVKPLERMMFGGCHAPFAMLNSYTSASGEVVVASLWREVIIEDEVVFSSKQEFDKWCEEIANQEPPLKPGVALAERAASNLGWL